MKVFLTGATGYIGNAIADALLKAHHTLIALVRSDEAARRIEARGIRPHQGDLFIAESLTTAAREAEAVIHAASPNDTTSGEADRIAVKALLEALWETGKPFIYTSGIWVIGDTGGRIADESARLSPADIVAWRPAIEAMVLQASEQGVRSIVIRPALVYGRGGGLPAMFVQSAREQRAARYIGTGENYWSWVHVDDLAALYLLAMEHVSGGTVLVAAHGPATRAREVAEAVSEAAGVRGRVESWALEEARRALGPLADALTMSQHVSGDRAKRLGWRPSGPFVLDDIRAGSYPRG